MVTQYDKAAPEAKRTIIAILIKVCAADLWAFPKFNSSLDLARGEFIIKSYYHIGVAVYAPRLRMPLSQTYDHRVIDGADGACFLRWICQVIAESINLV